MQILSHGAFTGFHQAVTNNQKQLFQSHRQKKFGVSYISDLPLHM